MVKVVEHYSAQM